ncbi:MAG: hypothetical protein VX112_06005 [Pseudomonadota bacterium]|nr:hypothetical protein [Pseudomonadota bacterium]
MLVTILAFLLAALILGKMILFLFFPRILQKMIKPYVDLIKSNYQNTQIVSLTFLILIGGLLVSLVGLLPMIASGWFWTTLYTLTIIPAYSHISSLESIKALIKQKEFKTDLQLVSGVYIAISLITIIYILFV